MPWYLGIANSSVQADTERWLDRQAEGWFWYSEEHYAQETDIAQAEKPPAIVSTTPPQSVSTEPVPLSAAWIRTHMQAYLDAAIDDPSPENVAAFLYLQRHVMDKSFAFMDAAQEATLGDPLLDEISRRPTATYANRALDDTATIHRKAVLDGIGEQAGLFVFLDNSPGSRAQVEVVTMLRQQHPLDVVLIATETLSSEFLPLGEGVRPDRGHAAQMGVTSRPAVVLVTPDGVFDVISQGPVSLSDLQARLLVGAKRLGLIQVEDFNSTRPVMLQPARNLNQQWSDRPATDAPLPASVIIEAFTGGQLP